MPRVVHVIGNGDKASLYGLKERKGLKIACNQTPFEIPDKWATAIVDYKFMTAMSKKEIQIPGKWICGYRPKHFCEANPNFHMQWAPQIREFYTELPKYAIPDNNVGQGYTNFNCGHLAVHYACNRLKAEEVHMYGFDSIFDFNMRSFSDLVLKSDRGNTNNHRLATFWRPIWTHMWQEFKDTKFVLHHTHNKFKVPHGENVFCEVSEERSEKSAPQFDETGLPIMNVSSA